MDVKLSNGVRVGDEPLVAGVISTLGTLDLMANAETPPPCDLIELRLGEIELKNDRWLPRAQKLRDAGTPVLITVRNKAEGGTWDDDDEERLRLFNLGLCDFSLVDVELNSRHLYRVIERAQDVGKPIIVSYHDFDGTPDMDFLNRLADQVADYPAAILKIAAKANGKDDVTRLEQFLRQRHSFPLCVLAMGEQWRETRITFPLLGSCLTYGYLDKPSAPGQHSCA